jgi:hypothetical protein
MAVLRVLAQGDHSSSSILPEYVLAATSVFCGAQMSTFIHSNYTRVNQIVFAAPEFWREFKSVAGSAAADPGSTRNRRRGEKFTKLTGVMMRRAAIRGES